MTREPLKFPGRIPANTADQCRALGLKVGDTIEGREEDGSYWHEARLTLLWIGEEVAVWSASTRSNFYPAWSAPEEGDDWTLDDRDWYRITAADAAREG